MVCHMGGFPTIRHNELRDITATLLTEVCHNVTTEPTLQPLSGENFDARSTNTSDGARVDIRARGFWNASQDAFFDVRVFYPNAPSNRSTLTSSAYRRHEQAKKREYGQRIREVEHGVFTPLVFSSTGGMGQEATTFYKRLASMISQKRQHPYPTVPLCAFAVAGHPSIAPSVGETWTSPSQHPRGESPLEPSLCA